MRIFGLILFAFGLLGPAVAYGQFGISSFYKFSSSDQEMETIDQVTHSSIDVRLNYWFRFKEIRVEFLPEIIYRNHNLDGGISADYTEWAIAMPTQFYLLDFISDCNCPTFSKQNDFVKKGWFISVIPEFGLSDQVQIGEKVSTFRAGLGTGVDIGISDLITVTPNVYGLKEVYSSVQAQNTPSTQIFVGIRILFRPDYKAF